MASRLSSLQAIGISSSPSPNSRSRILVERTLAHLETLGAQGNLIDLDELSAGALLARCRNAEVDDAIQRTIESNILILGTPVYRASYASQLKAFFDLLPQDALLGRVVGLIATGAGPGHALVIDHALRPLVASLSGLTAAQQLYVIDAQFPDKGQVPD
jgi:FMN reductase